MEHLGHTRRQLEHGLGLRAHHPFELGIHLKDQSQNRRLQAQASRTVAKVVRVGGLAATAALLKLYWPRRLETVHGLDATGQQWAPGAAAAQKKSTQKVNETSTTAG